MDESINLGSDAVKSFTSLNYVILTDFFIPTYCLIILVILNQTNRRYKMTTPVQNRSEAVRSEIVEQDHDPNIEGSSSYQIFKRLLSPFMNMGHNMVDSLEVKLDPIVPVKNRVHLKKSYRCQS